MVALAIVTLTTSSWAQQGTLSPEARTALNHYLKADCTVGQKKRVLDQLLQFKPEVELTLIAILRNGPDQKTLEKYQHVREEQWTRRESFLKRTPPRDLSEEDLKSVRAMTKDMYVKEGLARLTRAYRHKAAIALLEIGSADARKALTEVGETDEELRNLITGAETEKRRRHGIHEDHEDDVGKPLHGNVPVLPHGLKVN